MNKYETINNMIYDIKDTLSKNGTLSQDVEMKLIQLKKDIDQMRETEHQEKENIINLISKL